MKKGIINLDILTLSFLLLITLIMPFNIVFAEDEETSVFNKYTLLSANTCINLYDDEDVYFQNNKDVKFARFNSTASSNNLGYFYASTENFMYSTSTTTNACLIPNNNSGINEFTVNGVKFYYRSSVGYSYGSPYYLSLYDYQTVTNTIDIIGGMFDFNIQKTLYEEPFLSWTVGNNPYTIEVSDNLSNVYYFGYLHNGSYNLIIVSESTFSGHLTRSGNNYTITPTPRQIDGITYYTYVGPTWSYNPTNYTYGFLHNEGGDATSAVAYNALLSSQSSEQIGVYGDLRINFYTKYAATGSNGESDKAWRANLDVIQWNRIDTNGNDIQNYGMIEIRTVPGMFTGNTRDGLLNQIYSDFVLNNSNALSFGYFEPYEEKYEVQWGSVVQQYTNVLSTFNPFVYAENELWHKDGWIYQVRIVDKETYDPISDWQTIYNTTSYNSNDIYNNVDSLSPELVNNIENINNVNNVNNNYVNQTNWYINNTTINMQNSDDTQITTKPWWSYLLEAITSLLEKIIDLVGGIGSDLINGLFDLVNDLGVNVLDFFTNLWNSITSLFSDIDIENNENFEFEIPDNPDLLSLPILTYNLFVNSGFAFIILIPLVFILIGVIL